MVHLHYVLFAQNSIFTNVLKQFKIHCSFACLFFSKRNAKHNAPFLGQSFYLFVCLFSAAPATYGGSQAKGQIGAIATGLCHSHSNAGSEPSL